MPLSSQDPRFHRTKLEVRYLKERDKDGKAKGEYMRIDETSALNASFGRRSFLKASAAAVAAGAVLQAPGMLEEAVAETAAAQAPEETVVPGVCTGGCGAGCQMNVHVRDGKIVKTSVRNQAIPETTRVCNKGITHALRVYGENRIKYPMKRAGERGEGKWEQISWDEAITIITDKWKEVADKYGAHANCFLKSSGNITPDAHMGLMLHKAMGASFIDPAADRALYVAGPASLGYSARFCGSGYEDVKDAKNLISWGWNPTEATHYAIHYYLDAVAKGTKLTVIDPSFTGLAAKADRFIPIRPGSDGALAMALINVMVEEGLADEPFLATNTVAPFLVKKTDGRYLRMSDLGKAEKESEADVPVVRDAAGNMGPATEIANPVIHGTFEVDGVEVTAAYDLLIERAGTYTPEEASKITDVPVETIYELAHTLVDGPTSIAAGLGIDHYTNGPATYHAIFAAAMVAGQLGKPGSGIKGSFITEFAVGWDGFSLLVPENAPKYNTWYAPALLNCMEKGYYGEDPIDIKTLYVWNHNLFVTEVGIQKWREILEGVELFVVADVVMTSTCEQADIVLPVCHYFERESASGEATKFIFYSAKAAEPLYESKSDFEIFSMLAEKMGVADSCYKSVDEIFNTMFEAPLAKSMGITWDRVKEEGAIQTLPADPYVYGADGVWGTETGKLQFYHETIPLDTFYGQEYDREKECLPYWEPPMECWHENELAEKYPLVFTSERSKFRVHSQYGKVPWLLELDVEPYVMVNPATCAERGIEDGDYVRLFNDRGECTLKVRFNDGTRPGMVVIDHGWDRDQFVSGFYSDMIGYNVTPVVANSYYFDALIEMEKANVL